MSEKLKPAFYHKNIGESVDDVFPLHPTEVFIGTYSGPGLFPEEIELPTGEVLKRTVVVETTSSDHTQ